MSEYADNAWRIVRATIEEAEGRYGLTMYGRVIEKHGEFALEFACPELVQIARQPVAIDFLQTPEDADVFAEFGMWRVVRKWAAERDMRYTIDKHGTIGHEGGENE